MVKLERVITAVLTAMVVAGAVWAFETPSSYETKSTGPALYRAIGDFGLVNETGTTDAYDLGSVYADFSCEFTRTGTTDIVMHLQCSEYNLSFANIVDHTITTSTDTLRFVTSPNAGRKCRYLKMQVDSGADATTNMITNTVCGATAIDTGR